VSELTLRVAVGALAIIGAAVAGYLTYTHYSGGALYCPVTGGGCEEVQSSKYAEVAGIPVAVLGLAAYVALFVTAIFPGRQAAAIGAGITISGALFSGWLLYAQLALIDAVCQWCVANDVVIAIAAVASIARLRQST
jgi:uncharacterized membrane protein